MHLVVKPLLMPGLHITVRGGVEIRPLEMMPSVQGIVGTSAHLTFETCQMVLRRSDVIRIGKFLTKEDRACFGLPQDAD